MGRYLWRDDCPQLLGELHIRNDIAAMDDSFDDEYAFINSAGYSFLIYLLGVVQAFVGYFAYSLPFIGLAYQYGHASEKVDHVTMESDIDRFEQL